jgi:N-acetylglucosamine repressor
METYSSVNALLETGETLDTFFENVRSGVVSFVDRWNTFLDYLAFSMNNLHLVLNREFNWRAYFLLLNRRRYPHSSGENK